MKHSALLQLPLHARSGATSPSVARNTSELRTLLFEMRIPEFAQAQWQAMRSKAPWMESLLKQALRTRQLYTYAVQEDGRTIALYFFRRQKKRILVLNAESDANGRGLYRFTRYVFDHFPQIEEISFCASQRYIRSRSRFGRQSLQGIVLPSHPSRQLEEALRFGKRTVNYFLQRLKRDFPSHRFEFHADNAIDENLCRSVLCLPCPHLAGKTHDELSEAQENLIRAVRDGGMAVTLTLDGKVAAGVLFQRVGKDMHLRFLAHDPRLQAYGLGMLCCYFAACIHLNGKRKTSRHLLSKPRYRQDLEVQEQTFTAMRIHRPHASWLIRVDVAVYSWAKKNLERYTRFRDDCVQLGKALFRLASAWKLAFRALRNWRTRVFSPSLLKGRGMRIAATAPFDPEP